MNDPTKETINGQSGRQSSDSQNRLFDKQCRANDIGQSRRGTYSKINLTTSDDEHLTVGDENQGYRCAQKKTKSKWGKGLRVEEADGDEHHNQDGQRHQPAGKSS